MHFSTVLRGHTTQSGQSVSEEKAWGVEQKWICDEPGCLGSLWDTVRGKDLGSFGPSCSSLHLPVGASTKIPKVPFFF
jgi:hypothetical protein